MSNMIPFKPDQLPAFADELDDVTKALAGGNRGGARISIKGGVFRMMEGGKEVATNDNRAMNVVIVNVQPKVGRAFYDGGYTEGGDHKPPTCWSDDGQRPGPEVKTPVSAACATCPKNVKGSGQGESRACRFLRHMAVVLPNDIEKGKVYKMTLASTSLFGEGKPGALPLEAYAQMLASRKLNITRMVTEMRFDTSVSTPKLTFWPAGYLSEEDYAAAKSAGKTTEALNAIKTTVFEQDGGKLGEPEPTPAKQKAVDKPADKGDGPVLVKETKPVKEVPASTAAMLNSWDEE